MKDASYFEQRCLRDQSTGCWNWTGARTLNGYGKFGDGGRTVSAHRGAWEAAHGPVPSKMNVCHKCDNRRCVNIDHLFLGTQSDNIVDMHKKRRANDKLKEHDVSIIKWCLDAGVKVTRLASMYGVSVGTMSHIKTGRNWRWVPAMEYR